VAQYMDFSLSRFEDAVLSVSLTPAVNISGQSIRFLSQHRFGGLSGFAIKSVASGFNNVSGINVTDGVNGVMQITLNSVDSSGLDFGNYAYSIERLDNNSRTLYTAGFWAINVSTAP